MKALTQIPFTEYTEEMQKFNLLMEKYTEGCKPFKKLEHFDIPDDIVYTVSFDEKRNRNYVTFYKIN